MEEIMSVEGLPNTDKIHYLTTFEKMVLGMLLPTTGDVLQLREVKDMQEQTLAISLEDMRSHLEPIEEGGFRAKPEDFAQPVTFTVSQNSVVIEALQDLNRQKKLHVSQVGLYEKFVENKQSGPVE
jgi:hypothetical protein